jgi:hypothetical protein
MIEGPLVFGVWLDLRDVANHETFGEQSGRQRGPGEIACQD